VNDLRRDVKQNEIFSEKLEAELQHYRPQPSVEEDFEGPGTYSQDLIDELNKLR